jgi:chemotaxis protein MotB
MSLIRLLLVLACATASACAVVSREAYDRDLLAMRGQQDELEAQKRAADQQAQDSAGQLKKCTEVGQLCARDKQQLQAEIDSLKKVLDQCTNSRGQGARELADCQIQRDKLQRDLFLAQAELRATQASAKAIQDRLAKVEASVSQVRDRLKKLIEGGKLRTAVRNGFLVIEMQSDILFDTGKAEVKPAAKPVLADLASALKEMPDRRFQVAGHTDDRGPAALNWKLSVDRALAVVEELVGDGVAPQNLSAGGYGPYVPLYANDGDQNRTRNRRVEFLLLPDLSELLQLSQ